MPYLVLLSALLFAISLPQSVYGDISDGLISYWPLDEGTGTSTEDFIGDNDGSLIGINGGAPVWITPGKLGAAHIQCFNGSGSAGGVILNTDGNLDSGNISSTLMPASAFSVSAWVKPSAFAYYGAILYDGFWTGSSQSGFMMHTANGAFKLWVKSIAGSNVASVSASAGSWYHLVGTYNGSAVRLYVNGQLGSQVSLSGAMDWDPVPWNVLIGAYNDDNESYVFEGEIDDAALWNRALTTDEIDFLYNNGNGNPVTGVEYIRVTESGEGTLVEEAGSVDSYEVVLGSAPGVDVEITVTPSDAQIDIGAGAGVGRVLTFTNSNWDTPQTVNVSAYDDDIYEGKEAHITTITHTADGGDYTGINIASVEVEVIDNELTCGDWGYLVSDINKDCYVDMQDFVELASQWMLSLTK